MAKQAKNGPLGELLKQWRGVRGRSQLDISLDAGFRRDRSVSSRAAEAFPAGLP